MTRAHRRPVAPWLPEPFDGLPAHRRIAVGCLWWFFARVGAGLLLLCGIAALVVVGAGQWDGAGPATVLALGPIGLLFHATGKAIQRGSALVPLMMGVTVVYIPVLLIGQAGAMPPGTVALAAQALEVMRRAGLPTGGMSGGVLAAVAVSLLVAVGMLWGARIYLDARPAIAAQARTVGRVAASRGGTPDRPGPGSRT